MAAALKNMASSSTSIRGGIVRVRVGVEIGVGVSFRPRVVLNCARGQASNQGHIQLGSRAVSVSYLVMVLALVLESGLGVEVEVDVGLALGLGLSSGQG